MAKARIDEKKLFEAALDEFSTYPYEEASINRIIISAGISKGSFYYRFENKFQLYLYLLQEGYKKKWEFIQREMENRGSTDGKEDIFSLFLVQTEQGIRFARIHPSLARLSRMFMKEKGTDVYDQVMEVLGGDDRSGMVQMIDAAYERGEIDNRFSRDFAEGLLSFLFRSYDEIFPVHDDESMDKTLGYMKDLVSFMRHGLSG